MYSPVTIDSDNDAVLAMSLERDFATDFEPSRSLKSALFEVVMALNVESTDSGVIAVCGPRGVGKTSLAIQLEKKAKDILNFRALRLVVSQSTTTEQVQNKFAAILKLNLQSKPAEEREQRLRQELETQRGILIILDNVGSCKELNLESTGISNRMSCKVVVTASDDRELRSCSITPSKVIPLGHLEKAEACALLEENRWELLDEHRWFFPEENQPPDTSSDIGEVAKRIAKEFDHSTVSIITIGRGLRGKDYEEWMKAYKLLQSKLKKVQKEEVEKKGIKIVYRCVKLSFDYLTELEKKCFLLCSLFPDDHPIAVEDLKRYAWGLGIYDAANVDVAIETLTESSLLLKQGRTHIRMTNVVRDAALLIASTDKFLRIKSRVGSCEGRNNENLDYTAISYVASPQEELRDMEFPAEKLRILFLDGYGYKMHDEFLHQLTALEVVAIHHGDLSLNALRELINLKALHLEHCKLDGLSSLRELKKLEILSFRGSDISELPDEVGELKYLILLDVSECEKLERIPLNLIQRLSRLEQLYFSNRSFEEWWSKERSTDRSRSRTNSLPSLAAKSFENQGSRYESKALKVSALSGNESIVTDLHRDSILVADNAVVPNLVQSVEKMKVRNCDKCLDDICLVVIHSGQNLGNLTTLELRDCGKLQSLFSVILAQSLNKLETLEVHGCKDLVQIIAKTTVEVEVIRERTQEVDEITQENETTEDTGVSETIGVVHANETSGGNESVHSPYFSSLTTLLITDCDKLKYIFEVPEGQVFPKLTKLDVSNCFQLKAVFRFEQVAKQESQRIFEIEVPLLKWLKLKRLARLTTFCAVKVKAYGNLTKDAKFEVSVKLPELKHLEVEACNYLSKDAMFKLIGYPKRLEVGAPGNSTKNDKVKGIGLPKLELPKLRQREVAAGSKLSKNVGFKLIGHPKLQEFRFFNMKNKLCENILDNEGGRLLSCLKILILHDFNELQNIWSVSSKMVPLQNLEHFEVVKCKKLNNLFSQILARNLLALKKLVIQECDELVQLISQDQTSSSSSSSFGCIPLYFPNLEELLIEDCNKLKSLFPASIVRLPNLKKFSVRRASRLVTIFRKEEGESKEKTKTEMVKLQFLKLETLQLEKLPSLITINPFYCYFEFPALKSMQVAHCKSLVTKFERTESAPNHTVYSYNKTNEKDQDRDQERRKLRRYVTVVEIPTLPNGDINWPLEV